MNNRITVQLFCKLTNSKTKAQEIKTVKSVVYTDELRQWKGYAILSHGKTVTSLRMAAVFTIDCITKSFGEEEEKYPPSSRQGQNWSPE